MKVCNNWYRTCVPVVTWSTQDNTTLLQQLKLGFKRTICWNKYQSDAKTYAQTDYHLVYLHFKGINRRFVLSLGKEDDRRSHSNLPKVTIKDYNVMIDCKNFFDQPMNIDIKAFENIKKFVTGQGDDYAIGGLLDYPYFEKKIIAIEFK